MGIWQHTQQTILNAVEINSLMIWIPMCMRIWEQSVCVVYYMFKVVFVVYVNLDYLY